MAALSKSSTLLLLTLAVTVLGASSMIEQFEQYKLRFKKSYATATAHEEAFSNVKASLQRISALNELEGGRAVYGLTKFSDISPEQFRATMLKERVQRSTFMNSAPVWEAEADLTVSIPEKQDWRKKGIITPVKNQGNCGSCWAFSATESLESYTALWTGQAPPTLSPQQIVDCTYPGQNGCNGGNPGDAFAYIAKVGGLETEAAYPYANASFLDGNSTACDVKPEFFGAHDSGYTWINKVCTEGACDHQNITALLQFIGTQGPASICVDAGTWQDYEGGIITTGCPKKASQNDHCVQLVGYDTAAPTPYWLVRNSWGTDWGEQGYLQVAIKHNECGIADWANFPNPPKNSE